MKNLVGKRVKEARAQFQPKMTQAALAGKLQLADWDIDRAGVSKIEMGIRRVTDIELVQLARVLETPVLWLLEEETGQGKPALIRQIAALLADRGSDWALVGEQYPLSMGGEAYLIDLLYYHRSLKALVAVEVQAEAFKPVYAEKMRFYLAALDETDRKPEENHAVGLTICRTEERAMVQYTLKVRPGSQIAAPPARPEEHPPGQYTLKEVRPAGDLGVYRHYVKLADLPGPIAPHLPSEAEIYSRLAALLAPE